MFINIYVELSFICNCNLYQFRTYLCMLSSLLSCHCHIVFFRLYAIVTVMVVCCYSSKEATFKTYVFLLFFAVCDVPVLCFNPSFLWETWWQMFNKKPNRCNSAFFVFPTPSHYQWHLHVLLQRLLPNKGLQIGSLQVFRYATLIWNQICAELCFLLQMHFKSCLCYGFFLHSSIHYCLKKGHGFLKDCFVTARSAKIC